MQSEIEDEYIAHYQETNTFSDLRGMLEPEPKRGRVNRVLRNRFFTLMENGHWSRKEQNIEFYSGVPSNPRWHVKVLPLLIGLLKNEYGIHHSIKERYKSWL